MNPHDGIKAFAQTITPGQLLLGRVFHAPEPWAAPMRCFENVRGKIKRDGGKARHGWTFLYRLVADMPEAGYLIAVHHAVWHPPNSNELIDVMPFHADQKHWPITERASVLFLFNEAAQPVLTETHFGPLPSRFFPLGKDERLLKHVEELRQKEEQECRDIYGFRS